jgi:hypothetical protein
MRPRSCSMRATCFSERPNSIAVADCVHPAARRATIAESRSWRCVVLRPPPTASASFAAFAAFSAAATVFWEGGRLPVVFGRPRLRGALVATFAALRGPDAFVVGVFGRDDVRFLGSATGGRYPDRRQT